MKTSFPLHTILAVASNPGIVAEYIDYRHGEILLKGYLAYDGGRDDVRPGILVVHEWMGLGDHARMRAERLAAMGYIAFALDMYGKGIRAKNAEEASSLAGIYKSDRQLMRARALSGLETLKKHKLTDPGRIGAIGYCFGGTTVLELSRSGADVACVVSFHGGLNTPNPADARNIKGKVLVLHGADDPLVPPEEVAAFQDEMRQAGIDWQMVSYGGAVHGFTNPASGDDASRGVAYSENADRRSWEAMNLFFGEVFK